MFIDFGKFKEFVMQRTAEMAAGMGYVETHNAGWEKLSPKGKAVVKFLSDHTVDNFYKPVADMMSVIMGEDISGMLKKNLGDFIGAAVVPANTSGSYTRGMVFIVGKPKQGISPQGLLGGEFDTKKENNRPATEVEIDDFVRVMKESGKASNILINF